MNKASTVDSYITQAPEAQREQLQSIRHCIVSTAPDAVEGFAYGMPAYKYKGRPMIYFAAFANHIGLYATPSGHEAFAAELARYKQGKGSVQLPLNEPMPLELIARIVRFRMTSIDGGGR